MNDSTQFFLPAISMWQVVYLVSTVLAAFLGWYFGTPGAPPTPPSNLKPTTTPIPAASNTASPLPVLLDGLPPDLVRDVVDILRRLHDARRKEDRDVLMKQLGETASKEIK